MLEGGECKIITGTRMSVLFKTWAPNQEPLICKLWRLDKSSVKTTVSPEKVKSYSSFISLMPCLDAFSLCFKSTLHWLERVQWTCNSSLCPRAFHRGTALRGCPSTLCKQTHSEHFVKELSESTTNLWNETAALVLQLPGLKSLFHKTLLCRELCKDSVMSYLKQNSLF